MNSMMNYKSKELATMKIIKDILMVLVVLYHSMLCSAGGDWGPEEAYNTSRALYYISSYLNRIHIYAFTFVSGYIFSYLYFETDRYSDFCIVIRKKIKRLIIQYVSTMVLWVVPFYCFFWKPEAKILIEKFVLGTSPSQLWFLLMLFWQFVLFQALSSKILAKKKTTIVWGFVFAVCIYGGMILGRVGVPNFYQILTAMQYSLFFYFGMLFRRMNSARYVNGAVFLGGGVTSILLFAFIQYLYATQSSIKTIGTLFYPVVSLIGVLSFIVGILLIHDRFSISTSDFNFDAGMTVYLFHQQLIYISICMFNRPWMPPIALTTVNFLVGMLGGIGIHTMIKKNRLTQFLFGLD